MERGYEEVGGRAWGSLGGSLKGCAMGCFRNISKQTIPQGQPQNRYSYLNVQDATSTARIASYFYATGSIIEHYVGWKVGGISRIEIVLKKNQIKTESVRSCFQCVFKIQSCVNHEDYINILDAALVINVRFLIDVKYCVAFFFYLFFRLLFLSQCWIIQLNFGIM